MTVDPADTAAVTPEAASEEAIAAAYAALWNFMGYSSEPTHPDTIAEFTATVVDVLAAGLAVERAAWERQVREDERAKCVAELRDEAQPDHVWTDTKGAEFRRQNHWLAAASFLVRSSREGGKR